jgi:hypothetical protein
VGRHRGSAAPHRRACPGRRARGERLCRFGKAGGSPVRDRSVVPCRVRSLSLATGRHQRMGRCSRLRRIERLDPRTDHERIFWLLTQYEFPWHHTQGVSVAFPRDYGVPRIPRLLDRAQEFGRAGRKRYDDTVLIAYEMVREGLDGGHRAGCLHHCVPGRRGPRGADLVSGRGRLVPPGRPAGRRGGGPTPCPAQPGRGGASGRGTRRGAGRDRVSRPAPQPAGFLSGRSPGAA